MTKWLLLLTLGFNAALAIAGDTLTLEQGWVREGPPGSEVLAGFVTIHNPTDETMVIQGVDSPDFEQVEMHRSLMDNGMARMVKQSALTVPAHGSLELKPGGYHLMLIRPRRVLQAGDEVSLMFHTSEGTCLHYGFPVRKP